MHVQFSSCDARAKFSTLFSPALHARPAATNYSMERKTSLGFFFSSGWNATNSAVSIAWSGALIPKLFLPTAPAGTCRAPLIGSSGYCFGKHWSQTALSLEVFDFCFIFLLANNNIRKIKLYSKYWKIVRFAHNSNVSFFVSHFLQNIPQKSGKNRYR